LQAAGADINGADSQGRTAAHGAAMWGYTDVIRFLGQHGADLNVKDKRGLTPLDAAMGKLGNGGFDGSRADVHDSTVELIRQLMAGPSASR